MRSKSLKSHSWLMLIFALVAPLALGGCSATTIVEKLVSRDLDSALTMARAHGTESEARCFEALKLVIDKQEQIGQADADGIVSAVYKAWLLRHHGEQARQDAVSACLPVAAGLGLHMLTK